MKLLLCRHCQIAQYLNTDINQLCFKISVKSLLFCIKSHNLHLQYSWLHLSWPRIIRPPASHHHFGTVPKNLVYKILCLLWPVFVCYNHFFCLFQILKFMCATDLTVHKIILLSKYEPCLLNEILEWSCTYYMYCEITTPTWQLTSQSNSFP